MLLQPLDLTTALRPSLLPDEALLFVQDAVGLYEGYESLAPLIKLHSTGTDFLSPRKYKIQGCQNGHAYLTTHRACYVDNEEPRKSSIAVELKNVDRFEFYVSTGPLCDLVSLKNLTKSKAGFLKSSAKITLYPKAAKRSSFQTRQSTLSGSHSPSRSSNGSPIHRGDSPLSTAASSSQTPRPSNATWVCTICSFSNPVPANFDPASANANTALPPCLACGIKPSFPHVLKAAIANASRRQVSPAHSESPAQPALLGHLEHNEDSKNEYSESASSDLLPANSRFQCPRCTFFNHPSLLSCELCGASLLSSESKPSEVVGNGIERPESPGPTLDGARLSLDTDMECIKFSFRAGGEKIFHERLKSALVQRKWLLQNAPPIPAPISRMYGDEAQLSSASGLGPHPPVERAKSAGIAGLERRGLELRKKNEAVIGSAFEDLDALMASAKEIVELAESFAKQSGDGSSDANELIAESAKALDMVTTKDMLGTSAGSETLYLSEMSKNLAEYLTDDAKSILRKEGGVMSLVDLWALFNRARGGLELISPVEFEKAARLWEKLKLPVRLRQFKNGLLVVQQADRTDDNTIAQLLSWLQTLHLSPPHTDVQCDWESFGRGVTAQEAAQRFGWSIGVAGEELEMAEESGALCREEGVEGLRFWENHIVDLDERGEADGIIVEGTKRNDADDLINSLRDVGLL